MVLELISKKDCVGRSVCGGKEKVDCSHKNIGGREVRRIVFKRIDNRDRKKCHKCGHDNGRLYEQFLRGRSVYHLLCQDCINTIENIK
jgi:hypothetical protein